jgi:tyrosyl-tRNA synthetase
MDVESKLAVMRGFAEEIVTEDGLRELFESNDHPIVYDGFEPSGVAPIHFGLQRARNVKKMLGIGVRMKLYLADYFAFINNKLEGDMEKIKTAGEYFIEVWKSSGIDTGKVEIIWASDLIDDIKYWDRMLRVGKAITLDRIKRAVTIMGRKEGDSLSAAQLFYPTMQVTDVFQLEIDICQMGMEQRRANILAREVAEKYGWKKPVAVHHPLVLGLQGMPPGAKDDKEREMEYKMSKSNPKSAIYMHDSYEEIRAKVTSAYCPEKIIEGNPMFNFLKLVLLDDLNAAITISRPKKFGGDIAVESYSELVKLYENGGLHPMDLKSHVTELLEHKIKPVREHFEKNKRAGELYEAVKGYRITR